MSSSAFPPFGTSGPRDAKIAFVGEVWGAKEEEKKLPLVGSSGEEFNKMLAAAGLLSPKTDDVGYATWLKNLFNERNSKFFLTNVFHARGPLLRWCVSKTEAANAYEAERERLAREWPSFRWPADYSWTPIGGSGKYLHPKHLDVLPRLKNELESLPSLNLIVPLGAAAMWAVAGASKITAARGYPDMAQLVPKKMLPTFNPAYILRTWADRPIMIADLKKVGMESGSAELSLPSREIWLSPTIEDLYEFERRHIRKGELISFDIETAKEQIEMVGFATSAGMAIPVPFVDYLSRGYSYWKSEKDEILAWQWCARILENPDIPLVAQNGLFDVQFLWQKTGIRCFSCTEDTMFMHHSLQPEMKKGLAFLASIYSREAAWKFMRSNDNKEKRS